MERIQINDVLSKLSKEKKIFYSEGDFQFSLGCKLKCMYPDIDIILEKSMEGKKRTSDGKKGIEHIDMFVYNEQIKIGIELKFIKDKFSGTVDSNYYDLRPGMAYDLKCYDILKDIQRLKNYVENKSIDISYSIVLT